MQQGPTPDETTQTVECHGAEPQQAFGVGGEGPALGGGSPAATQGQASPRVQKKTRGAGKGGAVPELHWQLSEEALSWVLDMRRLVRLDAVEFDTTLKYGQPRLLDDAIVEERLHNRCKGMSPS